jgi:hypothetical protein
MEARGPEIGLDRGERYIQDARLRRCESLPPGCSRARLTGV